ncbi:capsular polysaccharide export protein [Advenella incenata]|uniref:Capsular polysaccharide export protein n=1 Tax=Advenella incenata TaxID=267800 RepID=A0A4Q7VFG4_9BURK|nr:capsular biosynthesis protein [Advenella incenata]RZT94238.1 capsular polysaccharide export protein [Advenella incenata]
MIIDGIEAFNGKNVLLLQGPVGPFFRRFALDLKQQGATVHAINFNGGDWLFNKKHAINFRSHPREWRSTFENLLNDLDIDLVFLFGDCRPIHIVAHQIAVQYGVQIGVFEEGYIRPNFITLEKNGVNDHSSAAREAQFYFNQDIVAPRVEKQVGYAFLHMMFWAILYYSFSLLLKPFFWHYRHHRRMHIVEGYVWIRSFVRKAYYRITERSMEKTLSTTLSKRYFLLPLQVYNDAQIHTHSDFATVETFIRHVVTSFSKYAPAGTHLVIKHHPMDRGYNDYSNWLQQLEFLYDLSGRVHYIHDQHLPTLLDHAIGTVVVNSTVGLSALLHGSPLKVCGRAMYDFKGLTFQGDLDEFWMEAADQIVDKKLFSAFRSYLIATTQINGNFYKRIRGEKSATGLAWQGLDKETTLVPLKKFRNDSHIHG